VEVQVPVARTLTEAEVRRGLGEVARARGLTLHDGAQALGLLARATAAVVASGTAATEAALVGAPMVVIYRVAAVTYWIARRLVRVPWVAMPNLLAGREVVPEVLQGALTEARVRAEVEALLGDPSRRGAMREALLAVGASLAPPRPFGDAVADEIDRMTLGRT
jgi:lipid-A-disaccharide synthase